MKKNETSTTKAKKESNDEKSNDVENNDVEIIISENLHSFVFDNIRSLDYRDIAAFIKIKPDVLKSVLAGLGIKVPVVGARKWKTIDMGKYRSISDCSKCQIQLNHRTFIVGTKNCHKCVEKNINYMVKEGEKIKIIFPEKL